MIKEKPNEYINRMVGLPWVKGADDPVRDGGLDCWGAVYHSFLCVNGVKIPTPDNRSECDFTQSMGIADYFDEVDFPLEGSVFGCYDDSGVMIHIGRVLAGRAYHAVGTPDNPGSVCTWSVRQLERQYARLGYSVKYYTYKGD